MLSSHRRCCGELQRPVALVWYSERLLRQGNVIINSVGRRRRRGREGYHYIALLRSPLPRASLLVFSLLILFWRKGNGQNSVWKEVWSFFVVSCIDQGSMSHGIVFHPISGFSIPLFNRPIRCRVIVAKYFGQWGETTTTMMLYDFSASGSFRWKSPWWWWYYISATTKAASLLCCFCTTALQHFRYYCCVMTTVLLYFSMEASYISVVKSEQVFLPFYSAISSKQKTT